ncbi:hypothetical protein [Parvularcula lutaonensis]|uniref:DUF2799 domain-containing protein n=1 Tax=Parvularcula lutaonensis TaxID=491923 RepID=A0ABV7MDR1_9PROT|nr:hypothetical protein [Parvularcula lutaonensis]GGY53781.1 hypothetical protein GCM10007148_23890 [Parvularcula lutaonensis]
MRRSLVLIACLASAACVSPDSRVPYVCADEDWFLRGLDADTDTWAIGGRAKRLAFFRSKCGADFDQAAYLAGEIAAKNAARGLPVTDDRYWRYYDDPYYRDRRWRRGGRRYRDNDGVRIVLPEGSTPQTDNGGSGVRIQLPENKD